MQECIITIDHMPATKYRYIAASATRAVVKKAKQGLFGQVVGIVKYGRIDSVTLASGLIRSKYRFEVNTNKYAHYKYGQLSGKAKQYALERYGGEQAVEEQANDLLDQAVEPEKLEDAGLVFDALGWVFNEDGKRIV